MFQRLNNGIKIRWFNTAGFEMILPGGAHVLVDPWLDSADLYSFPLDQVERADYILLSHIHGDHAEDIARILEKFPKAKLFLGDLSVDPLCREQHVSLTNIYRVRSGEEYTFDDVKINIYAGRHTESARGDYRPQEFNSQDMMYSYAGWYGSLELQNYLVTASDGTRVLIWSGMTTADQRYRLAGLKPDIALMHLSPKQIPSEFAALVKAIGTKVVIPHHYDVTHVVFNRNPKMIDHMLSPEAKAAFVVDGLFSEDAFVGTFTDAIRQAVPHVDLLKIDHHRWYYFGLGVEAE